MAPITKATLSETVSIGSTPWMQFWENQPQTWGENCVSEKKCPYQDQILCKIKHSASSMPLHYNLGTAQFLYSYEKDQVI